MVGIWKHILDPLERLKNNIGLDGNLFENAAISEVDGTIKMMTIDQEAIDTGLVHSCFYGMSAVYPPKNGLGSEGDREVVEKYGKIVDVPCITFKTLLEKHNITSFDVLKIDAEGHDYQIFNQLDLNKFRPKLIRLEWVNLNDEQKQNILTSFEVHKYYHEGRLEDIKKYCDGAWLINVSNPTGIISEAVFRYGEYERYIGISTMTNYLSKHFAKKLDAKEKDIMTV